MMEDVVVDIGTQLKDQREKLGYSLQEAAQHTRIRKTYLESIENNKFSDLPGHAYVTGFIKSYALYLGVDNRSLLEQLEKLPSSDGHPSLKLISVVKHQSKRFSKSSSGVGWRSFVYGLFGVLLFSVAAYLLAPMFQDKVPTEVDSAPVVLDKQPLQKPLQSQTEETFETSVASNTAEQTFETSVASSTAEQDVVSLHGEPSTVVDGIESPELKPLPFVPAGGSSLRMLALAEGSLIIYIDDRKSHQYKLHDGLDLTWDIKGKVKVELASPGTARFWLDKQELELDKMGSFQLQTETGD